MFCSLGSASWLAWARQTDQQANSCGRNKTCSAAVIVQKWTLEFPVNMSIICVLTHWFGKCNCAGIKLFHGLWLFHWIRIFICILTDISDAICFLLVGPSDLAAKSTVEVMFCQVTDYSCCLLSNSKWHIVSRNWETVTVLLLPLYFMLFQNCGVY